ncbi:hypothetical protein D3C87_1510060 [compost metagenome]
MQGQRRRMRIIAARADGDDAMVRGQHVAVAGQDQRIGLVGHDHHGLELAQIPISAPVLGQFDGGAHQLVGILLELAFEPLEQGEGIGGGAGKAAYHRAIGQPTHLLGAMLHDRLAHGDLAVASHHHLVALAHGNDRGPVPAGKIAIAHWGRYSELLADI